MHNADRSHSIAGLSHCFGLANKKVAPETPHREPLPSQGPEVEFAWRAKASRNRGAAGELRRRSLNEGATSGFSRLLENSADGYEGKWSGAIIRETTAITQSPRNALSIRVRC
jgi:hypothetical protein